LYGTVHNEGAAKGILVTTSGYGKSAYEFAQNKPLELITASNLLFLLEEHTGLTAKIDFPETWVDPMPDAID
jgi:restriction system protein